MLSQENIDKLVKDGVYKCEPMLDKLPSYRRNEPYHCVNWVFRWFQGNDDDDDDYYMRDTYWSTGDNLVIQLTDENFDKFKLVFRNDEVKRIPYEEWMNYNKIDRYRIALDSGGWNFPFYFIKKDAKKDKKITTYRIESEIAELTYRIDMLKNELLKIQNDNINYTDYEED